MVKNGHFYVEFHIIGFDNVFASASTQANPITLVHTGFCTSWLSALEHHHMTINDLVVGLNINIWKMVASERFELPLEV